MRRIAIALSLVALVAVLHACAADAPTKPPAGGGGGQTSALSIQLFTSDANPKAGTCTQIEAVVTLNGNSVPDGTSVVFTSDFGTFSQNSLPTVSVVTTGGQAVTALCGPGAGQAKVKATATSGGKTGSANLVISFQPSSGTLPFVSACQPSFGDPNAPQTIVLTGGRFFGTPATSKVQFTANGITKDGLVTDVATGAVTVQTPQFPELTAPSTLTSITLTLGTNLSTPVVLSLPNCFSFGTSASNQPTITAILPSQGSFSGGTRVTIIGSGFATSGGVQVFFGNTEATVVSTTFSQIVAISPAGPGGNGGTTTVGVTVKNITSGLTSAGINFTYGPALKVTSINPVEEPSDGPFTPLTIFGTGFQAPVAVIAGQRPCTVSSVSATEIVCMPTGVLVSDCSDVVGPVVVTNVDTGDTSPAGPDFRYLVKTFAPALSFSQPSVGDVFLNSPITVTLFGSGLSRVTKVTFGNRAASFQRISDGQLTATVPDDLAQAPACPAGTPGMTEVTVETVDITVTSETGCTSTLSAAFTYQRQCVSPTPTPAAP
ncbi:MAG TPA: IPT/TIG domain-containing protein [Thermoanaerobaculia bacterium]